MRGCIPAWLGLLCAVCCAGHSAAQGAQVPEPVRLTYEAPSECPTRTQFEAQVSERVSYPWLANDGDLARPLKVSVVRGQTVWQANLQYRANDGQAFARSVTAATCDAAVGAIALATALLIERLVDEGATRGRITRVPAPLVEPTLAATSTLPPEPPKATVKRTEPPSPPSLSRPDVGLGVAAMSGISESPAYGLVARVGIPFASTVSRFGVAFYQSSMSGTDLPGVTVRSRLFAAVLEECPVRLELSERVNIPLCVSAVSGVLATNSRIDPAAKAVGKTGLDFWLMASLSPRLRIQGPRLFVELGPDWIVPLTRRDFVIARENGEHELAYRTPVMAFGAQSALFIQF